MRYIIFIPLFVVSLFAVSLAAQDSAAQAGKNTAPKVQDSPAKSSAAQTLEEEDMLIDETVARKTAGSAADTPDTGDRALPSEVSSCCS